jgi:hypothetical protein
VDNGALFEDDLLLSTIFVGKDAEVGGKRKSVDKRGKVVTDRVASRKPSQFSFGLLLWYGAAIKLRF